MRLRSGKLVTPVVVTRAKRTRRSKKKPVTANQAARIARQVVRTEGPDLKSTLTMEEPWNHDTLKIMDITQHIADDTINTTDPIARAGDSAQINGIRVTYAISHMCPYNTAKGIMIRMALIKHTGSVNTIAGGSKIFMQDDGGDGIDFSQGGPKLMKCREKWNWQKGLKPLVDKRMRLLPSTDGASTTPAVLGKFYKKINKKVTLQSSATGIEGHRYYLLFYYEPLTLDAATTDWVTTDDVYVHIKIDTYYKLKF